MSAREERVAKNEAVFREVNERIRELSTFDEKVEFLCECGDAACLEPIAMAVAEYERIRAEPTWFFVADGHVVPEAETVVERLETFQIVAKRPGVPAGIAVDFDPRD